MCKKNFTHKKFPLFNCLVLIQFNLLLSYEIDEVYQELHRGLKVLVNKYTTAEARDLLSEAIPKVFVIQKHIQQGDHAASLDIVRHVNQMYEKILKLESKHDSEAPNKLAKRFVQQSAYLLRHKTDSSLIFAWLEDAVKALRKELNHGKSF